MTRERVGHYFLSTLIWRLHHGDRALVLPILPYLHLSKGSREGSGTQKSVNKTQSLTSLVTLYTSLAHQLMWVKNYGGKRKRLFRLGCNAEFHFIGLASSLCKFLPLRYTLLCANVLGILIKKRPIHHNYELVAQTMYPDSCKVQPICI